MDPLLQRIRQFRELLRRRGESPENAEDLIQEAFLRLHVYCQTGEVKQEGAFLRRTVLNLAVDLRRKEHSDLYTEEKPEDLELMDFRPTPDEELAIYERLTLVQAELNSLAPRTREIFVMHRLEGHNCARIARTFGISVSAVEKHIARAVFALMDLAARL